MAQYNLITNSSITSNTTSGVGNKLLSVDEIMSLYDNNTTSSGVTLSGTDVLCLDIDIGFRVRLDNIKLYMNTVEDRASSLNNINFYYKNLITDPYTVCDKDYDSTTFFITNLPTLFAPRYVRVIIDGVSGILNEVILLNDDTQVSFGEQGGESLILLNQSTDDYDSLGIFNNSPIGTLPVDAYVIVDYDGRDSNYYVKLSNSIDGQYIGLKDGIELKNNDLTQNYTWDMGIYNNTTTDENGRIIANSADIGYYTSPLFDINNKFNNTFIITDQTMVSGTLLSYSDVGSTSTMMIRSSDNPPDPFNNMFWIYREKSTNKCYLYVGNMSTGYVDSTYWLLWTGSGPEPKSLAYDRRRGHVFGFYKYNSDYRIARYDYVNKVTMYYTSYSSLNNVEDTMSIDVEGCVWGYVKQSGFRVVRFDYTLSNRTTIKEDNDSDFLGGLSADINYPSCWYTNIVQNKLEHTNAVGDDIASITISSPSHVTSLPDGGCWVISTGDFKILRYSYYGDKIQEIDYAQSLTINDLSFGCKSDKHPFNNEVFWMVVDSTRVLQIDFNGNLISDTAISSISSIKAFPGGCLVFSSTSKLTYQLNEDGGIVKIYDFTASNFDKLSSTPIPVTIYYEEYITLNESSNILPLPLDPYWGTDSFWHEVPLEGIKLPLYRYHQVKFKFVPKVINCNIINPGAEDGNTGWNSSNYTTSYHYTGSRAFSFYKSTTNYQRIDLLVQGAKVDIIDKAGYMVRASAMLRVNYSSDTAYLRLYNVDEFGNRFGDTQLSSGIVGTAWRKEVLLFRILPNTRYLDIGFSSSNYWCYGDDYTLDLFETSSLDKIIIPSPTIIKNIKPQEFKNIYIKTEIPDDAEFKEYETKLKCWWGNREEN